MLKRLLRLLLLGWCLAGAPAAADAQSAAPVRPRVDDRPIVFVNVNLIRMDRDAVEPRSAVVVRSGRIGSVGPMTDVPIPEDAVVIDGQGRYLLPGLTDAHVHLTTDMPWARTRPDFGEGPLYLANGVTTVVNLRGSPEQLEWRDRVAQGTLIGPTIYTSGEFVNEPRVTTPAEVRAEIYAQRAAGYDLIKFHEVWDPRVGFTTTGGLTGPAYAEMMAAARDAAMPIVGHAPTNLGLDAMLDAKQPLAHLGMLSNIYFLPLAGHVGWLLTTAVAFATLTVVMFVSGAASIARRRREPLSPAVRMQRRLRTLLAGVVLTGALAFVSAGLFLPGGPWYDSLLLRLLFTALVGVGAGVTISLIVTTLASWDEPGTDTGIRLAGVAGSLSSAVFVAAALFFWLPIAWRSSDGGILALAARVRDAGIPVETTLVAYDTIGGRGKRRLAEDPTIAYLLPETQTTWQESAETAGPPGYRYTRFMQKLAGALHRAGVPLIAATDAMGASLLAPGSTLHREFDLLVESGLTPYDVIRAATVAPATFLQQEDVFGTIAPGMRADLLLVDANPLEDVRRLRDPAGVMANGRWYPRGALQELVSSLYAKRAAAN